jgi:glycosyltransferase involved in cell wall biosynthesis
MTPTAATHDVSVVVATRNRAARLRDMLAALEAQTFDRARFRVIVVDDGSTDDTARVLEDAATTGPLALRWMRGGGNGPAIARNLGWRATAAPLIAFTDDDCVPSPGWLAALVAAAREHGPQAIVQGPTLPRPDELDGLDAYAKTVRVEGQSPHFETCNVVYPRVVLERVGGFDEGYGSPAGEDSDLGWRAIRAGAVGAFAPEALVHHAVHRRGPRGPLQDALLATDGVRAYKTIPELRQHLHWGVFYGRSHAFLAVAVAGVALVPVTPASLLLAAPYARHLVLRARHQGSGLRSLPVLAAHDAVQIAATLRGAVRHRVFVL